MGSTIRLVSLALDEFQARRRAELSQRHEPIFRAIRFQQQDWALVLWIIFRYKKGRIKSKAGTHLPPAKFPTTRLGSLALGDFQARRRAELK